MRKLNDCEEKKSFVYHRLGYKTFAEIFMIYKYDSSYNDDVIVSWTFIIGKAVLQEQGKCFCCISWFSLITNLRHGPMSTKGIRNTITRFEETRKLGVKSTRGLKSVTTVDVHDIKTAVPAQLQISQFEEGPYLEVNNRGRGSTDCIGGVIMSCHNCSFICRKGSCRCTVTDIRVWGQ